MEGGTRTQFILKLLLLGACALKVAAKQFYFVSFDGSNNQNHQEVRDTGTNVDEDYYPNGLCACQRKTGPRIVQRLQYK